MIVTATYTCVCVISLAVGSFMAVAVRRSVSGRSTLAARSRCESCDGVIAARHLVPIVSAVVLKHRCAMCGASFSKLHVAMEAGALAIAGSALWCLPAETIPAGLWLGWILLLLAGFDADSFTLPLPLTLTLTASGLLEGAWLYNDWPADRLAGAASGLISFAALTCAYRAMRRRDGLGGGDALLFSAAGAWLGWPYLPWVAFGAALAAIACALIAARAEGRTAEAHDRLPFGTFLAPAIWIAFLIDRG